MGKSNQGTWGKGRPAKAGPGRPKGSKGVPQAAPTGFAGRPRPGPGRPKGKKNTRLDKAELVALARSAPDVSRDAVAPTLQSAAHIDAIGWAKEAEKPGSGIPYLVKAAELRKLVTPYLHSPKGAEPHALPKSDVPNVVRVPLPAQSAEAWQAEADLWRAQQAKIKVGNGPDPTIN